MYSYIVIEGDKIVSAWQTLWDSYIEDPDNPERKCVRVTDEEYAEMHTHLEDYIYTGKKYKEKTAAQKKVVQDQRKALQEKRGDTEGLQQRVVELEATVAELKKSVKK